MNAASRLSALSERVAAARRADRERCGSFFEVLRRRVAVARTVERELDRRLARRFNALDYLRTDELGLSRIVADLLDPRGAHGQGTRFLARFLDSIGPDRLPGGGDLAAPDGDAVAVATEREIDGGRRLDISVELRPRGRAPLCVAIENKPYAADGEAQIADYLRFLKRCYGKRFLLVYLSPAGGRPSEEGLPRGACEDGLATLSYCRAGAGGDAALRLPFSLTDWLRECRELCEAERLRWFLREVETFCRKTFGGTVTMSEEERAIRDFILSSDENVRTTIAVVDVWPETRDDVAKRFLKALRDRIDEKLGEIAGIGRFDVEAHFGRGYPAAGVRGVLEEWQNANGGHPAVWLRSDGGIRRWYVGVRFDPGDNGAHVAERLAERLSHALPPGNRPEKKWPWYRYVDEHTDWSPLVARLHRESREPGELIDYFSRQFVDMAEKAAPIVEDVLAGGE